MQLSGCITALATPFTAAGEIDLPAWRRLLQEQLDAGIRGVVVAGSTGEAAALFDAEYDALLRTAVEQVGGRIPVLAGTGQSNTAKTIEANRRAAALGADGALVVTPPYVRPTQAGLLARLTQQPYVAHNATFEHSWFMLNVAGYAESYRAGRITIIDTLPMSRQWDPGAVPTNEHPYGDNTLDAYAKRQGALDSAHNERHLGLEDSHIMLVAMKHHLAALKAQGKGPWGSTGRAGVGGKSCGRKR